MLNIYRRQKIRNDPSAVQIPGHPIFEVMYYIDCEERSILHRPWLGPLPNDIHCGIELFKARWLWNRRQENPNYVLKIAPAHSEFVGFIPGRDPKSLYLDTDGSRYRGYYEDGTAAEIPSDEVNDCSLSEALATLVRRRVAHEEAVKERARLANYTHYAYDDPLDDPRLSEPAAPRRVRPRVPVVRTLQDITPGKLKNGSQIPERLAKAQREIFTSHEHGAAELSNTPRRMGDQADIEDVVASPSRASLGSPRNLSSKESGATNTAPPQDSIPSVADKASTSARSRQNRDNLPSTKTDSSSNLSPKKSDATTLPPPLSCLTTSNGNIKATFADSTVKKHTSKPSPSNKEPILASPP